jgi:hypothetical protein
MNVLYIQILKSYLTENTACLHCEEKTVYSVWGSNRDLLWKVPGFKGGRDSILSKSKPYGMDFSAPSFLYNRYRPSPGIKRPGRGTDNPPSSSAGLRKSWS